MDAKKIKCLGIDFGSSKTTIVGLTYDGELVIFGNSHTAAPSFLSAIGRFSDEENYFFFEEAYQKSKINNLGKRVHPELTDNLKEGLYNRINGKISEENVTRYFTEIFKILKKNGDYDFSALSNVCFGHPAYYAPGASKEYIEALKPILEMLLRDIFGVNPTIIEIPEPVLAATAYNYCYSETKEYKKRIKHNDVILVLDFGGHTMDISLMQANKSGDEITLSPYKKSCSIDSGTIEMGKAITRSICGEIYVDLWEKERRIPFDLNVEKAKCELFSKNGPSNPSYRCLYKSNPDIERFVLEYDCKRHHALDVAEKTVYVGMHKGERTINIENIFHSAINQIRRYVCSEEIDLPKNSISHILFTGGSSNIPQLREHVKSMLSEPKVNMWKDDNRSEFIMDETVESARKITLTTGEYSSFEASLSSANAVAIGAALVATKPPRQIIAIHTNDSSLRKEIAELKKKNENLIRKGNETIAIWMENAGLMDALAAKAIQAIENPNVRNKLREEYMETSLINGYARKSGGKSFKR